MLKDIIALWRKESLMLGAVETLADMIGKTNYAYTHAWEVCIGKAIAERIKEDVRLADKAVNKGERSIRRTVVEHLNLNPGRDVSGCLAIMLMAKDVERIGDHCRNIYALGALQDKPFTDFRLFRELDDLQKKIEPLLPALQRAVAESSESLSRAILASYQEIKQDGKSLQTRLFGEPLAGAEAVATTLVARAFVRINAHIGNTASGVIFPLENIDFVSRGLRKEQQD